MWLLDNGRRIFNLVWAPLFMDNLTMPVVYCILMPLWQGTDHVSEEFLVQLPGDKITINLSIVNATVDIQTDCC